MRTDKEIEKMIPLFYSVEVGSWPEGVVASELLTSYLSGKKNRFHAALLDDLRDYCDKAFELLPTALFNPLFGLYVADAIVVLWMLGDDKLMIDVARIEPDADGIVQKLYLIYEAYKPIFDKEKK